MWSKRRCYLIAALSTPLVMWTCYLRLPNVEAGRAFCFFEDTEKSPARSRRHRVYISRISSHDRNGHRIFTSRSQARLCSRQKLQSESQPLTSSLQRWLDPPPHRPLPKLLRPQARTLLPKNLSGSKTLMATGSKTTPKNSPTRPTKTTFLKRASVQRKPAARIVARFVTRTGESRMSVFLDIKSSLDLAIHAGGMCVFCVWVFVYSCRR